jgi:hypothetical protein
VTSVAELVIRNIFFYTIGSDNSAGVGAGHSFEGESIVGSLVIQNGEFHIVDGDHAAVLGTSYAD